MFNQEVIRVINAAKKFKIKKEFEFIGFEDITSDYVKEHNIVPDSLELWAAVKIFFDGELPESYKALNLMIGDWVETNVKSLTETIHKELEEHIKTFYTEATYDLDDPEDSSVWLDQLDYMPLEVEDEKSLIIEIELVLNTETPED